MEKAIERVFKYLKYKDIKHTRFEKEIGLSNGYLNTQLKRKANLGEEVLNKILDNCLHLNPTWLLTGRGEMLLETKSQSCDPNNCIDLPSYTTRIQHSTCYISKEAIEGGSPFYNLPVSAGSSNGNVIEAQEIPTGYIKVPGVKALEYFPVVGCSMKPLINPGDIVGVVHINSWDRLDPDAIYFIVTHDERMIKHLRNDPKDETIIWCISPNHKEFSIPRSDIYRITKVVFRGQLV